MIVIYTITIYIYYTEEKYMLNFVLCDDNKIILDKLSKMLEPFLFSITMKPKSLLLVTPLKI